MCGVSSLERNAVASCCCSHRLCSGPCVTDGCTVRSGWLSEAAGACEYLRTLPARHYAYDLGVTDRIVH